MRRGLRQGQSDNLMAVITRYRSEMRWGWLGAALVLAVPAATSFAQSIPLLGYAAAKNADPKRLEVFRQGLTELGYVEGRSLQVDHREAVLDAEYPHVMAALLDRKVRIILAANAPAAVAAAKATSTTPIVMLAVNDPVGLGLVKSLEHPGTNVTVQRQPRGAGSARIVAEAAAERARHRLA
jgi:hypothetical protein